VRNPHFEKLPRALDTPENLKKEFKSSFQWDIGHNCKNLDVRLKTLKTIVAFLNSEGGVLFIGINDNRTVRGIKEDLELFASSTDKFLLQVRDLISDRIGAEFAPLVKTYCESAEGKTLCIIEVEKAIEPAFLKGDDRNHFYAREGPRTNELDPKETNAFIRTKRWDD
jgi:predicted HTH transcriptional regulator